PQLRLQRVARSLAQALEASGRRRHDDDLRVGSWYLLGGGGDPAVLLSAAGQAQRRFDLALAERLARAALEAGAGLHPRWLAAHMAMRQGRGDAAEMELAQLAVSAPDETRRCAVALARIENCMWYRCNTQEGLRLIEEAQARLVEPVALDQIGLLHANWVIG